MFLYPLQMTSNNRTAVHKTRDEGLAIAGYLDSTYFIALQTAVNVTLIWKGIRICMV